MLNLVLLYMSFKTDLHSDLHHNSKEKEGVLWQKEAILLLSTVQWTNC